MSTTKAPFNLNNTRSPFGSDNTSAPFPKKETNAPFKANSTPSTEQSTSENSWLNYITQPFYSVKQTVEAIFSDPFNVTYEEDSISPSINNHTIETVEEDDDEVEIILNDNDPDLKINDDNDDDFYDCEETIPSAIHTNNIISVIEDKDTNNTKTSTTEIIVSQNEVKKDAISNHLINNHNNTNKTIHSIRSTSQSSEKPQKTASWSIWSAISNGFNTLTGSSSNPIEKRKVTIETNTHKGNAIKDLANQSMGRILVKFAVRALFTLLTTWAGAKAGEQVDSYLGIFGYLGIGQKIGGIAGLGAGAYYSATVADYLIERGTDGVCAIIKGACLGFLIGASHIVTLSIFGLAPLLVSSFMASSCFIMLCIAASIYIHQMQLPDYNLDDLTEQSKSIQDSNTQIDSNVTKIEDSQTNNIINSSNEDAEESDDKIIDFDYWTSSLNYFKNGFLA